MIRQTIELLSEATRALKNNLSSLAIFAGLYALLLAALYGFVATREATILQVLLTLLFVGLAPLFFFLLQAAIINHARRGRIEWHRVLADSTKLALAALPVIALGIGIMWLLNRWQAHYPTPYFNPHDVNSAANQPLPSPPFHLPTILFGTLRALLFIVLLPLALLHLWIEVAGQDLLAFFRGGLSAFGKRLGRLLSRAFSTPAVLIYALGLIVFALIPYVLLFFRITMNGAWSEIAIFTTRLLLVFLFTLLGWVITLSALVKSAGSQIEPAPAAPDDAANPVQSASVVGPEVSSA